LNLFFNAKIKPFFLTSPEPPAEVLFKDSDTSEDDAVVEVRVESDWEAATDGLASDFTMPALGVGRCPPVPYLDCKVARAAE